MPKIDIEILAGLTLLYKDKSTDPRTLLLVSKPCGGTPNIMPFTSWSVAPAGTEGWRFTIYIIVTNHSHEAVKETGQFTVNLPRDGMKDITDYCGSVSGRDHDKFEEGGLTAVPSREVTPPIIKECGVHLECATLNTIPFQLTFPGEDKAPVEMTIFESKILAVYADDDFVRGMSGRRK